MSNAPNIGDVGASVQKSTDIQGQQPGSSGVSRTGFSYKPNFVNFKGVKTPKGIANQRSYNLNFNQPFASFNKQYLTPDYTPSEFLALTSKGYVGAFTNNKKTVLSLMGPAYTTARALWDIHAGRKVAPYADFTPLNQFGTHGINIAGGVLDVAKVPTPGDVAGYAADTIKFSTKYGADGAGYVKRYGHMPEAKTKYGYLFGANAGSVVADAVSKFRSDNYDSIVTSFNHDLSQQVLNTASALEAFQTKVSKASPNTDTADLGTKITGLKIAAARYSPNALKTGKGSMANIKALQTLLNQRDSKTGDMLPNKTTSNLWKHEPVIVDMLNSVQKDQGAAANAGLTPETMSFANMFMTNVTGGLWGAAMVTGQGDKAIAKMAEISQPTGILAPGAVSTDNLFQAIGDVTLNAVKSYARMSAGIPMGLAAVVEGGAATIKNVGSGNFDAKNSFFGVDTTLASAVKQDYVRRYVTPFDSGVANGESWKKFATIMGQDPIAPVMDVLSLVPVVGEATKGIQLVSTLKAGSAGALEASTALEYAKANDLVAQHAFNPATTKADIASVAAAQTFVDTINVAKASVNARSWAGLARKAYLGDTGAMVQLDNLRQLGLVVPKMGKEAAWTLKAAAKFEPRSIEMPRSVRAVNTGEGGFHTATRRLPASPLARGAMQGTMVITRGLQKVAAAVEGSISADGAIANSTVPKYVTDVLIKTAEMPYNWQYSRALTSSELTFAGDMATYGKLANTTDAFAAQAAIDSLDTRVILAVLGDSNGASGFGRMADPAYQRTIYTKQIAEAKARMASGEISSNDPTLLGDIAANKQRIADLPDQVLYEKRVAEFSNKLENPTGVTLDISGEKAYEVYTRMKHLHEKVQRMVHGETPMATLGLLHNAYSEVFSALDLKPMNLFGAGVKPEEAAWRAGGELYKYRDKFVTINDNFPFHEAYNHSHDSHNFVLDAKGNSVFDKIKTVAARKKAIDDFNLFMQDLRKPGVLRDHLGSPEASGRPVLVLADKSKLTDAYFKVYIARLEGGINNGMASRSPLIDTGKVYTVPRELFNGKVLHHDESLINIQNGALNAAHDMFPTPQFFSDKVSASGISGVRANFKDAHTENIISTLGLKDYTLRTHILSQKYYLRNRIEHELLPIAEHNAELVPLADINNVRYRGYHMLKHVEVFNSVSEAEAFAKARGIHAQFRAGVANESANPGSYLAADPFSVDKGFGVIIHRGQKLYVVKGNVMDIAQHALAETGNPLNNNFDYRRALYNQERTATGTISHALMVPPHIDKVMARMVEDGNGAINGAINGLINKSNKVTNIWKRLVLFGSHFIGSNIIGGFGQYLIHNPLMAGKAFLRLLAYGARKAGVKDLYNAAADGAVVAYHMAYEDKHNIYREEAQLNNPEAVQHASRLKKYGWNGSYAIVAGFEHMLRTMVAKDFLEADAAFKVFAKGPDVKAYIKAGVDHTGAVRNNITAFEAAVDLKFDPTSIHFDPELKTRMRYVTNTVSGNYHSFSPLEQLVRNTLSPFYAWQRHSLAFNWRLGIDKPITANVLNNVGQYGYIQTLNNGLPSWMDQTIPLPSFIENVLPISAGDHRIDLGSVLPFGTTADLATAFTQLFTGQKMGANIFSLLHPDFALLIKSVLNFDPQTGTYINKDSQTNLWGNLKTTLENTPGFKIPKTLLYDSIFGSYSDNALANKYKIVSYSDLTRNYDPAADPKKPWSLRIPKESTILKPSSWGDQAFNVLFPLKAYSPNIDRMPDLVAKEAVAAGGAKIIQDTSVSKGTDNYIKQVQNWIAERDYVYKVILPDAKKNGWSQAQIDFLISKVEADKGDNIGGLSFDAAVKTMGG